MLYCRNNINIILEEVVEQLAQHHSQCRLLVNPLDQYYLGWQLLYEYNQYANFVA